MHFIRTIIALVLLATSSISLGLTEARVIGDNLNVRKLPNGLLIEQLAREQLVKVVNEESGWSQIVYIKENTETASYGWVASRYLELQFAAESTECVPNPHTGDNYCLALMAPNLQCKMDEQTSSYSGCSVNIKYELSGAEDDPQKRSIPADVNCAAHLDIRDERDGVWTTAVQSNSLSYTEATETAEIASMELNFTFGEQISVRDARVSNTDCRLVFSDPASEN